MNKKINYITAALLVIATFQLPYGYYTFLRLIVSISSGISLFNALENDNTNMAICFGLILILFNPIFPIYLDSSTWFFIDLAVAGIFGFSGMSDINDGIAKKEEKERDKARAVRQEARDKEEMRQKAKLAEWDERDKDN